MKIKKSKFYRAAKIRLNLLMTKDKVVFDYRQVRKISALFVK
jgi:hypothetical protein